MKTKTTPKSEELPKGFNCETCGTFHRYALYVYAHTRDILTHTCEKCGAEHEVIMLSATQTKPGKPPLKRILRSRQETDNGQTSSGDAATRRRPTDRSARR